MELLEYLCIGTDCVFISDLRECTRFHSIKNALNNLDVRQYTIQKWNLQPINITIYLVLIYILYVKNAYKRVEKRLSA